MSHRREFLLECGKAFAALMLTAACEQEKLFRPRGKSITPDFFGHMVQGDWVLDDGTLVRPVSAYFGVLRLWDSRAVWWKMETATAAQSLLLQASLGVVGAVWNPETSESANDYTDSTMRVMADLLIGSTVGPISVSSGVSRCVVSKGSVDTELVWTQGSFPLSAMRAAA